MIERVGLDLWAFGRDDVDARCITTNGTIKRDGRAVMGKGCAREALLRFRRLDRALARHIERHGNVVGVIQQDDRHPPLVAFPVKHAWHEPADLALIEASASQLVSLAIGRGWMRVVLPRPGCGNGGLDWKDVRPRLAILDDRFLIVTKPEAPHARR